MKKFKTIVNILLVIAVIVFYVFTRDLASTIPLALIVSTILLFDVIFKNDDFDNLNYN